ncbi:alpha/beta hydrolase family protein [Embleya sp. NPDC008237]|uniref:alpha/beta hydrolase family protein n=1 Tax=Embleya sp. NPDC008237 TaxID=3363978 RepID=UPI0036EE4859
MDTRGFDTRGRNTRTAPLRGAPTIIAGALARRFTVALALAGVLTVPVAATARADASTPPPAAASEGRDRGALVDAVPLRTVTAGQARDELGRDGWDFGTVRDDVRLYRLVYRTIDATGRPTTATGLLALPVNDERRLRAVSFTHGTELYRADAPSTADDTWGIAPALTLASAGFAATMPDYLGQGEGPGAHPWMDIPSETTASLDLLRAARRFAAGQGRSLAREVYVSGFSQGASAALGLARALRSGADPWFRVGAIAPISGAYDFRRAELPALLRGDLDDKASVIYASLLLVSYNRLHHVYDRPADVFRSPYADTIEGLLDGSHRPGEILEGTPANIDGLLTGPGRDLLERPTGAFAAALRETDSVCTDWRPRVPVRLYVAVDDREAAPANTAHCRAALRASGTDVRVTRFGPDVTHSDSNRLGTAAVVRWFRELG